MKPRLYFFVIFCAFWREMIATEAKNKTNKYKITIDTQRIDTFVQRLLECKDSLSAVSVAIVQLDDNDQIVGKYSNAYGPLDPLQPQDGTANPDTIFCIGSITKQFNAAVVGLALEDKGLDYDAKLVDLLGEEGKFYNDQSLDNLPTVRDLLAHRMAVAPFVTPLLIGLDGDDRNLYSRNLHKLAGKMSDQFRNSFQYSNWMTTLAGYVAEKLTNKTWEQLVNDTYFKTLNLNQAIFLNLLSDDTQSGLCYVQKWPKNIAMPAVRVQNFSHPSNFSWFPADKTYMRSVIKHSAPAGAICLSAQDMLKYLTFLVNSSAETRGSEPEKKLKKKIVETMDQVSNFLPPMGTVSRPEGPLRNFNSYSLGLFRGFYREYEIVGHAGGIMGWLSYEVTFPKLKLGIMVSTSNGMADNDVSTDIAFSLFDIIMNENDAPPDVNKLCSSPVSDPQQNSESFKPFDGCFDTHNSESLEPLNGTYQHRVFGNFSVKYDKTADDWNRFRFNYGYAGHGLLCPEPTDPDHRFRLYFDQDSPYYSYKNIVDASNSTGFEINFSSDNATRGKYFVFPELEPNAPTTDLQTFYKHGSHPCDFSTCQKNETCLRLSELNFVCQSAKSVSTKVF